VALVLVAHSEQVDPQTREMMTSWLVCGYVAWQCQWFPGVVWVMLSQKESKANELVNYVRILYGIY
jgi:hypothetical protein